MSKFKAKKRIFNNNGQEVFPDLHNKPMVSRRDFLSAGLIPFAATMVMPSLLDILLRSNIAEAQETLSCPEGNSTGLVPLITLNLSGGAALTANWVPRDQGLELLPSYDKMGLGSPGNLTIETAMGASFAGNNVSRFLVGLKNNAPTAMARTKFVGVPVRSRDDSSVNKFDISGMAAKAGYAGGFLPNLGRQATATGTKNDFAFVKPPTPLSVGSFNDLSAALGVSRSLNQLSKSQKASLFKMINGLNTAQARKLASVSGGKEMASLVKCAADSNFKITSKADTGISPLSDPSFATVWNINQNTGANTQDMVFASMVYNCLKGNSGTANLEMGGYDYHNGTRTSGDNKDEQAGDVVGKILESAAVLGTKVFVVVTSDGAVVSAVSEAVTSPWLSDRGSAGASYMLAFDPAKVQPANGTTFDKNSQLGYFNNGQAADESFLTGGSPEMAAAAIFANYLSFSGKVNLFESTIPRVLNASQLNQVIKIFS